MVESTVKIELWKDDKIHSFGTGFFYGRAGHLITNFHVISPFLKDKEIKIKVFKKDPKISPYSRIKILKCGDKRNIDLCLLKIEDVEKSTTFFPKEYDLRVGHKVGSIGHCSNTGFTLKQSSIIRGHDDLHKYLTATKANNYIIEQRYNKKVKSIEITGETICEGDSGGPVFLAGGDLVGVVSLILDLTSKGDKKYVSIINANEVYSYYLENRKNYKREIDISRIRDDITVMEKVKSLKDALKLRR